MFNILFFVLFSTWWCRCSMSSFRRRFLDSIRCRGKIRHRHTMSSVYRTSQTYINSLHQTGGGDTFGRPDGLVYSAFSKRNSSSRAESGQSIKLTTNGVRNSNNNKITRSLLKNDSQHFVTANSDLWIPRAMSSQLYSSYLKTFTSQKSFIIISFTFLVMRERTSKYQRS